MSTTTKFVAQTPCPEGVLPSVWNAVIRSLLDITLEEDEGDLLENPVVGRMVNWTPTEGEGRDGALLDSLDFMVFIQGLEEDLNIKIPDAVAQKFIGKTAQEIAKTVSSLASSS